MSVCVYFYCLCDCIFQLYIILWPTFIEFYENFPMLFNILHYHNFLSYHSIEYKFNPHLLLLDILFLFSFPTSWF